MKKYSKKKLLEFYKRRNAELKQDVEDLLSGDETKIALVKAKYQFLKSIDDLLWFGSCTYSIDSEGNIYGKED